jgi:hypothetical protein
MATIALKRKTLCALGLHNVARVFFYRLRLRLGIHPVQHIAATMPAGAFFRGPQTPRHGELSANRQWLDAHRYFGWFKLQSTTIPDWFTNPFTGKRFPYIDRPWWQIPDFNPDIGDIKTIWEASRCDWVIGFAQQASQGDTAALDKLNRWLADWSQKNPPYFGPNWKCGQEASIRAMHLAMAALMLDQVESPLPTLQTLIRVHLMRIAPTLSYAIAQDNNHGTSEAAALFIGGSWLATLGDKQGRQWAIKGQKWLTNRAGKLIEADGSFSQYSINYHRVMLDTYCMAEIWRRKTNRPAFRPRLYERLKKAAYWLYAFTNQETGDAPNLGANDGARLLPLTDTDCRDYRPTVQLSMALFNNCRAYEPDGAWNFPLQWLDIPLPHALAQPSASEHFMHGGYAILRHDAAVAMLRYPQFRFRPSHADALHLDFWLNNENVLRDGGSFSYADSQAVDYFSGTASHNTIQFNDRDQMPRLGRFLFGEWIYTNHFDPITEKDGTATTSARYKDWQGASHARQITLSPRELRVTDEIGGFMQKAVLRWRLAPGAWKLDGNRVSNGKIALTVTSNIPIKRLDLTEATESRYYLQKTSLPVLEVEVNAPGKLFTVIEWE